MKKYKKKMKKAKSSFDLVPDLKLTNPMAKLHQSNSNLAHQKSSKSDGKHKVVIYFSDAYNNICNKNPATDNNNDDVDRLADEMQSKPPDKDFMAQLKTVLEEKSKFTNKFDDVKKAKPAVPAKPIKFNQPPKINNEKSSQPRLLPSFIESIDENNVINLKIEQNFRKASELVSMIASLPKRKSKKCDASNETSSIHELSFSCDDDIDAGDEIRSKYSDDDGSEPDEGYFYDWSFVQEWRSR